MKRIFDFFRSLNKAGTSSQQQIIDFVCDPENIKTAAEGSMQKRLDLIQRVEHIEAKSLI
jgi:hypothetical protein